MRKKLIEVALPLEAINEASVNEKAVPRHGHPQTLHLWWARRPLAASRAVIFTSLVDDPDDPNAPLGFVEACRKLRKGANASVEDTPRQRLFDFIETLVQWENSTDKSVLETARELILLSTDGNPPALLDPFAGGGTIPLEAQRLGLESHARDLNPVAVIINKALIEIPPRFADLSPINPVAQSGTAQGMSWSGAQGLANDVRYYGERILEKARARIGNLYPNGPNGETILAWLWAKSVKCPNPACGAQVPLVRSFWISQNKGRQIWIEPIVNRAAKKVDFEVKGEKGRPIGGTIGRSGAHCLVCDETIPLEHIRSEGVRGRISKQLLAMFAEGQSGRTYLSPSDSQIVAESRAHPKWEPATSLPDKALGFRVQRYGVTHHKNLFTSRQLAAVSTVADLINEVYEEVLADATRNQEDHDSSATFDPIQYAAAIKVYLACALSRLVSYNNVNCVWNIHGGSIAQIFTRQTISMSWDFIEANPLENMSGNWIGAVEWVSEVVDRLAVGVNGLAIQGDATQPLEESAHYVFVTDPPYYDNIGYAALSDFFYIWLRHVLGDVYPDMLSTILTPKSQELIADPDRHSSDEVSRQFFEQGLRNVFSNLRAAQCPEYPMTVFYAFKQQELLVQDITEISSTGWETMLAGLIEAGFSIMGTWPIRTERQSRMRSIDSNALASSIVLVCRPRPDDAPTTSRREFVNALRRELPPALREMQSGSIAPVDLAQASIGPGMAVYSRYSRVLEADGSPLTVRTALQLINQELDAFLAETEGDVDADTRFAVSWFEQFGFKAGEFGVADVLARAKNTSVDGLVNAGVVEAGAGKVRLMSWGELDPGWTPQDDRRVTVWEAVHHLIERLNTHGEQGAASLLAQMDSDLAAEAKNLAYRLYQICDRKGWAEYALEYNAVVLSWPGVQQQANTLKQNRPPEQLGMF